VFLDTTALYFEGEGGKTIGERGHSKDHRPDLNQMVVGALLDDRGKPIACEMWPGNTADVTNQHHPGRHEAKETIRAQQVLPWQTGG
jgi:transposase